MEFCLFKNPTQEVKDAVLKSADYNVARIIPRGSSGGNLDKGLLSLYDAGTEDIRIDAGGNSWIDTGNNLGIGNKTPQAKLHVTDGATILDMTDNGYGGLKKLVTVGIILLFIFNN